LAKSPLRFFHRSCHRPILNCLNILSTQNESRMEIASQRRRWCPCPARKALMKRPMVALPSETEVGTSSTVWWSRCRAFSHSDANAKGGVETAHSCQSTGELPTSGEVVRQPSTVTMLASASASAPPSKSRASWIGGVHVLQTSHIANTVRRCKQIAVIGHRRSQGRMV